MNVKILIDAIIRQTTLLIAQLSTAAGIRAPLAHIADHVFLDLARELEQQGLGRKVVADMFGMALRGYQKKVQRLEESAAVRDQTLWEALLEYIRARAGVHRRDILERFRSDGEEAVAAVLRDLSATGMIYVVGQGPNTAYGPTSERDLQAFLDRESADSMATIAWVTIYHHPGIGLRDLVLRLNATEQAVRDGIKRLASEGRLEGDEEAGFTARTLVLPVGASIGWEAAVLDHFQTVATAIASKVRGKELKSQRDDIVGGATLHFDVASGHPLERDVFDLLKTVRAEVNVLWDRVCEYNRAHPIPEDEVVRVAFYFGQNYVESGRSSDEMAQS